MKTPSRGLILVVAASLLAVTWSNYGPFLVWPGPYPWGVTLPNATFNFGYGLLWVLVVAVTYRRDPHGRMWKLILAFLVMNGTWPLGYIDAEPARIAADLLGPVASALLVLLVLAFPSGHLRDRVDVFLLTIIATIVGPIQLLQFVVNVGDVLRMTGFLSVVLGLTASLEVIRHWRIASPAARRSLAPVAVGMPLVLLAGGVWWVTASLGRDDFRVFLLQSPIFGVPSYVTPALFLAGLVRARLVRGAVADLIVELGRGVPVGGLRPLLARVLRDPTLELAFAGPGGVGLVDPDGRQFTLPEAGGGRAVTRLERDGETLGVLVHDPALEREDAGLLDAVGSVARLALENERLSAQVRAQLDEVRASRLRIIEAGDVERRRVERDLHDGAQQRLVTLTMRLEAARSSVDGAGELIDRTTAELRAAIGEVRDLARGLHPPILSEAGLRAAIESLAERTPIPVEIDVPERRFPAEIESAVYFVVAEALTNVARYAAASVIRISLRQDDERLTLVIVDDGHGGADASRGTGIRGLEDRLAALGGTLSVTSSAEAGTAIRAELPVG